MSIDNDQWYRSHENIVTVAYWMADNGQSAAEVAAMVEKPWKYTDEWEQAREVASS